MQLYAELESGTRNISCVILLAHILLLHMAYFCDTICVQHKHFYMLKHLFFLSSYSRIWGNNTSLVNFRGSYASVQCQVTSNMYMFNFLRIRNSRFERASDVSVLYSTPMQFCVQTYSIKRIYFFFPNSLFPFVTQHSNLDFWLFRTWAYCMYIMFNGSWMYDWEIKFVRPPSWYILVRSKNRTSKSDK